jgi:hypothetical protein
MMAGFLVFIAISFFYYFLQPAMLRWLVQYTFAIPESPCTRGVGSDNPLHANYLIAAPEVKALYHYLPINLNLAAIKCSVLFLLAVVLFPLSPG